MVSNPMYPTLRRSIFYLDKDLFGRLLSVAGTHAFRLRRRAHPESLPGVVRADCALHRVDLSDHDGDAPELTVLFRVPRAQEGRARVMQAYLQCCTTPVSANIFSFTK